MSQPVQPDPSYVVAALTEELHRANDNRVYLLSVIRQLQAEHEADRMLWAAERESLTKGSSE